MVEMAESKAKLRKLRQQLEEKTEQLAECKVDINKDLFHFWIRQYPYKSQLFYVMLCNVIY